MKEFEDSIIFFAKCFAVLISAHLLIITIISIINLTLKKNKDLIVEVVFKMILFVIFILGFTYDKYYLVSLDLLAALFAFTLLFFKDWQSFSNIISKKKSNKVKQKLSGSVYSVPTIIAPTKINRPNKPIPFNPQKCNNDVFIITDPKKDLSNFLDEHIIKTIDLTDTQKSSTFNPYDIPYEYVLKKVYALIAERNYEALRSTRFVVNDLTSLSQVQKRYILN